MHFALKLIKTQWGCGNCALFLIFFKKKKYIYIVYITAGSKQVRRVCNYLYIASGLATGNTAGDLATFLSDTIIIYTATIL